MANKSKPKFPGKLNVNQIDNTYVKPSIVKELQNKSVASKTTMPIANRFSDKVNTNKVDNTYVAPSVTKDLTVKTKTSNSTIPVSNWPANKNKNAVAEAIAKRKPVKKEKVKEEDNDSWLENVGEFVDPTGVSSYDDVYRAYKNTGLSGETALEAFGALPLIGKIGKSGKVMAGGIGLLQDVVKGTKYLPSKMQQKVVDKAYDVYKGYAKTGGKELDKALGWSTEKLIDNIPYLNPSKWKSSTNAINSVNAAFKAGKVSDAVQSALGSKDDSGFTYNPNDDNTLKYNGRNILPDSGASENMYANGGMIKRADGSYSQRGLWDNIRANKGSGKAPTKEMLKQESKINAKYPEGGKIPVKNIQDFNKKYGTNYKDKYEFTGVNDKETQDFFKEVKAIDPALESALYREHLAYGKPKVTKATNPLPIWSKGAASYNSLNNKIYLHDREVKGGDSATNNEFRFLRNVDNYVNELAHSVQNNSNQGLIKNFVTKDIPQWVKNKYYDITIPDKNPSDYTDKEFKNKNLSTPYDIEGNMEHQAHHIIAPFIKKDIERKINEYNNKKSFANGGTIDNQALPKHAGGGTADNLSQYRLNYTEPKVQGFSKPVDNYMGTGENYHSIGFDKGNIGAEAWINKADNSVYPYINLNKNIGQNGNLNFSLPVPINGNNSFGIGYTHKFAGGGRVPIVVNNPNDLRLRAYNDSNALYTLSNKAEKVFKENPYNPELQKYNKKGDALSKKSKIKPVEVIGSNWKEPYTDRFDRNRGGMEESWMYKFKKPVQPYVYEKAKPSYQEFISTVNPNYIGNDYNLEEAYNNLPYSVTSAWAKNPEKNHLPDTYKLPNHETFSNESKYYKEGMPAVKWENDKAIPINQLPQFQPDIVQTNIAPNFNKPKLYQGYDFMQQTGLKPGDYTEEQVKEAMKNKGTKQLANKYSMGGYAMYGNKGINNPGFKALPENIQKKILAKMAKGGKVGYNEYVPEFVSKEPSPLPRFAEAGTVDTGAGISDYTGYAQMAMPIAHMLMPDQQVKDNRGNVVGNKMDTGYAVGSKALEWGAKGAQFGGPAGAIVGALVGGGMGYLDNDANNKKIDKETRLANDSYYNENTSKAFNTNTGNFTQRRSNNTNMSFARGGQVVDEDMGNPNAELELNETFRDPMTGETGMVDGPSHDNGGIEVNLPEGTQIWSDRLKHNGRTFASLTKPIINKIANLEKGLDSNPNSRFKQNSIKLLNSQLDFFFNVQESNKQQDEMKRTLKKQEGGVVDDMGNYHYANGGIYIKPENRGKFTAYKERTGKTTEEALHSPDPHVRQMANFAKNAAGWKHAEGGTVQYPWGGLKNMFSRNRQPASAAIPTNISNIDTNGSYNAFSNKGLPANTWEQEFASPSVDNTQGLISKNMNPGTQIPLGPANRPEGYIDYTNVNTPETMQGRQLPNYSLQSPNMNLSTNSGRHQFESKGDYYMNNAVPNGNGDNNLYSNKNPAYNLAPLTAPVRPKNVTITNPNATKAVASTGMTPEEKSAALRNRIDSFRNRGKIGQVATGIVSNLTQADRLKGLARPDKINNVNYLSSLTGPDLVNYGNQRNAIEQSTNAITDKAGKYLGNSGSIMATVNAANLAKQQQLGESYQGQENANAAIMNNALAQKNQLSVAQAERNSAIQQENNANNYAYNAMIASGLNANDAITANQMGQMYGNDVTFGNDLEKSRVLSNMYNKKVWDSTNDNTIAANNSQLRESKFGGVIGKLNKPIIKKNLPGKRTLKSK